MHKSKSLENKKAKVLEHVARLAKLPDDAEVVLDSKTTSVMTGYAVRTLETQRYQGTGLPYVRLAKNKVGYLLRDVRAHVRSRVKKPRLGGNGD